jgi:hypothetical protein
MLTQVSRSVVLNQDLGEIVIRASEVFFPIGLSSVPETQSKAHHSLVGHPSANHMAMSANLAEIMSMGLVIFGT